MNRIARSIEQVFIPQFSHGYECCCDACANCGPVHQVHTGQPEFVPLVRLDRGEAPQPGDWTLPAFWTLISVCGGVVWLLAFYGLIALLRGQV